MCVSGLCKDKQTTHVVAEALLEVATGRGWPAMVASSFGFPKAAHQPPVHNKVAAVGESQWWCVVCLGRVHTLLLLVMVM